MEKRVIVGVGFAAAVVEGLLPGAVPMGLLPLLLVILGLVYGVIVLDAENCTDVLVLAVAVMAVASSGVLSHLAVGDMNQIGDVLNRILGQFAILLGGVVVAVLGVRTINRIKG